jgi:protein SCO1/2
VTPHRAKLGRRKSKVIAGHRMRRASAAAAAVALLSIGPLVAAPPYTTVEMTIEIPNVTLIDQDAQLVELRDLVEGKDVVMVDFIFGTCTTICPILSAGFSNLQRRMGSGPGGPTLISFSIDPEHDSPEIMATYLKRYRAQPGWSFLTGTRGDIDLVMRAFDAYVPDKMSHQPISFIKVGASDRWLKIDGLVSTKDLLAELEKVQDGSSDSEGVQR